MEIEFYLEIKNRRFHFLKKIIDFAKINFNEVICIQADMYPYATLTVTTNHHSVPSLIVSSRSVQKLSIP